MKISKYGAFSGPNTGKYGPKKTLYFGHFSGSDNLRKLKTEIKKSKEENYKNVMERLKTEINDKEKRLGDTSTQTGVSNWFTVLPITELDSNFLSSSLRIQ